jgi:hypothetical protein
VPGGGRQVVNVMGGQFGGDGGQAITGAVATLMPDLMRPG